MPELAPLFAIVNDDKLMSLLIGGAFAALALSLVLLGVWIGRKRQE
jgi:hypothetical protein